MSEINSIAQGTYTLGQTSATTYQAGPGISITQPSEGIIRIDTNETILYDTPSESATSSCSLSESRNNFEFIRISLRDDNQLGALDVNLYPSQTTAGVPNIYGPANLSWFGVRQLSVIANSDTTLVGRETSQISWTSAGAFRNYGNSVLTKITRVVGVNRVGGNA